MCPEEKDRDLERMHEDARELERVRSEIWSSAVLHSDSHGMDRGSSHQPKLSIALRG